MMDVFVTVAYVILFLSLFLGMLRLLKGPTLLDRILAFDYLCGVVVALIAVRSIERQSFSYIEMILIFSLLGFATVISFMELFFVKLKRSIDE